MEDSKVFLASTILVPEPFLRVGDGRLWTNAYANISQISQRLNILELLFFFDTLLMNLSAEY
jgi:hypothetical protein